MNDNSRQRKIRGLNDQLRRTRQGGRYMMTCGVEALGANAAGVLVRRIVEYDDFDDSNDPYGEHDFGCLEFAGEKVFWKIDYYDAALTGGSPDPADPDVTVRVLTIMLASEY